MLWIPFWAAGVINGIGHWFGYRNGKTRDGSRNIFPLGIWIGGEELHNNHHLDPANGKLSKRWYEFDLGWFWIKIFSYMKLIKIKDSNDK
jgi:stearoyl-CoA desaturase (delta-9 desaturase)